MKKMVLRLTTGTCGTDATEFYLVPDSVTEVELSDYAWERALENADSFGIYPPSDEYEDEDAEYDEDIGGSWAEYEPSAHAGLRTNGHQDWEEF